MQVNFIEPNRKVTINAEQKDAPSWGLGRVSHKEAGNADYVYDDAAGEGITFYGVDTGIEVDNADFEGRAEWGTNTVDSDDTDCNGHGTHTAGTVAGKEYGLAKKASIVSVKVLDCQGSGTFDGIIEGINWSVEHAKSNGATDKAVMNLSLGGQFSQAVNDAAAQAVKGGLFLAVAAGNENQDASNSSPASTPEVCTTAASDDADVRAEFSNYGEVVDIFAPGVDVVSVVPGGGEEAMSGTSMAAPHVAGVAATLMVKEGLKAAEVCDRLIELSAATVSDPGQGTTDKLLYNDSGK